MRGMVRVTEQAIKHRTLLLEVEYDRDGGKNVVKEIAGAEAGSQGAWTTVGDTSYVNWLTIVGSSLPTVDGRTASTTRPKPEESAKENLVRLEVTAYFEDVVRRQKDEIENLQQELSKAKSDFDHTMKNVGQAAKSLLEENERLVAGMSRLTLELQAATDRLAKVKSLLDE